MEKILAASSSNRLFEHLLVGNESCDDAAVYDIGDGKSIISTTDFFTPIVDDPYDFGRIAAVNALSDVYAMGGKPLMALAVLAWPLNKIPAEQASEVIRGARFVCDQAGIPLAGGHSINASDPIFGLAVTGIVETTKVKRNSSAKEGHILYITKALGSGIISTAQKFSGASEEHVKEAVEVMSTLNTVGAALSDLENVSAMTDVTGFGLGGHLLEMLEGSGLDAHLDFEALPLISGTLEYKEKELIPGGTYRNYKSYGEKISMTDEQMPIICDPQTSGGLLIAAQESDEGQIRELVRKEGGELHRIGILTKHSEGSCRLFVK